MLIAENIERRGEAESNPIKKARIGEFVREYWKARGEYLEGRPKKSINNSHTFKDVAEAMGESERTTRRLIKLNHLIPEIQYLVSNNSIGVRAAEQLAYLTEEEQSILFQQKGNSLGDMINYNGNDHSPL
ncbi:hypothetical protein [Paenibacillus xylanexedens]|uniref:hypothetical protein n=1 Tax=Paenibacillus xylanexedens TaxID=528191 RepID=UPI00119DB0D7|nr:hypothetical protein [Paenibacillus xylanexedens]